MCRCPASAVPSVHSECIVTVAPVCPDQRLLHADVTTYAFSAQAAGSSLLAKLTCVLAADALRVAGLQEVGAVAVLPLATGMALTVTLLALKARRPPQAKCVLTAHWLLAHHLLFVAS